MKTKRVLTGIALGTVIVAAVGVFGATATSATEGDGQTVVVHLSNYSGDLHAAFMATKLATAMQKHGASVTLFLDLEGVRMADDRVPLDVMWGTAHAPLSTHFNDFLEAGGHVILCPHCAEAAGIAKENLREGANIGIPDEQTIPKLLLKADKILDY